MIRHVRMFIRIVVQLFHSLNEHIFNKLKTVAIHMQPFSASLDQGFMTFAFGKRKDPGTGAIGVFGMKFLLKDLLQVQLHIIVYGLGLTQKLFRVPFHHCPVMRCHVLWLCSIIEPAFNPAVLSNLFIFKKNFNSSFGV